MPVFHNFQSKTLSVTLPRGFTSLGLQLNRKEVTMANKLQPDRQTSQASSSSLDSGYESLASSFINEHPDQAIQDHFTYLRESVNLEVIKDWLIQNDVIDEYLKDQLANTRLSFERKERLLKELIRKGPDTCKSFLRCLREEDFGQIPVYEELKRLCYQNLHGENKNRYVLGYLSWRTLIGLHKKITLSMQVPYHGRCLVDAGFGHIKRLYRRTDIDSLSSMINVVDKSAKSNVPVGYENPRNGEHNWEWYDWKTYLSTHFSPLPGIRKYRHFTFDVQSPGSVQVKETCDGVPKSVKLLKSEATALTDPPMPTILPPAGRQQSTFHITKQHLKAKENILINELESQTISDGLFEQRVFNIDDHDEVCNEDGRMKKAMKILTILERKDDDYLDSFLWVLENQHCTEILRELKNEQSDFHTPKYACRLLQHSYREVLDNMHAEVMLEYLRAENQLADTEYQTLREYRDRSKQSRLVKTVIGKGGEACGVFVDGLMSSHHRREDLVNQIKRKYSSKSARRPHISLSRNFITIHHSYLRDELEVLPMIDILLEEFVFDVHEHDNIEEKKRRPQKISCLLAYLVKVTNYEHFNTMNWAFETDEYRHLLEELQRGEPSAGQSHELETTISVHIHEHNVVTNTQGLIPNTNIVIKLTATGEMREVIHDGIVQSFRQNHESRRAFEADTITHTAMEVDDIDKGSVVIHVHPLTDDGVKLLMDATRNNKLKTFIHSMLKHANLTFLENETVTFKVEMKTREPGAGKRREIHIDTSHRQNKPSQTEIEQSMKDHWDFLLDELEPRDLTRHFIKKGIFTQEEGNELLDGEMTRRRRVDKFLRHVLSAENQGIDFFIKLLKDHGLMHIVKKLDVESQDIHHRAECIRRKIIENFSLLLDEVESPMISHTMKNCRNITDAQKQLLHPRKGTSRRTRIQEFLKMVLNNDEYLLEFERTAKEFGIWELVKCDEDEVHVVSEKNLTQDPTTPGIIFQGTFEITFQKEEESEISKLHSGFQNLQLEEKVIELSPGTSEVHVYDRTVTEPIPGPSKIPKSDRKPQPLRESTYKRAQSVVFSYSQQHEKKVVAAIDFGTTYSGYAYSTKDEIRNIQVCKSSQDNIDKHLSLKIPTSILLSPTKKVLSIGSEAETDYKALADDDEHMDHYFFRRFKMELHKSEKLHRNTVIKDSNGRSIHAMEVFKLYITKLKEMLMTDLDRAGTMVGHDEIFWVLTIPAIWNDAAKQFMREAAEKAGISPHNIMLALEPEVAALFVKESRMGVSKDRESLTTYNAGAKFLVMDLGGGTADLTAMEVTTGHSLKQLKFSCGGDWGGESVNKEFWKMIESLVGGDVMEDYKLRCHGDYMEMDKQFETKKRNLEDFDNMDIKLDGSFIDLVAERRGKSLKDITKEEDFSYLFQFKGASKLTLLPHCIQKIFMPSLNKLLQAASNMLEETTSAVTDIIMVGGFSDSKIVRQMVKRTFPKHRVIEPVEASLAVLKGAVLYGHDPIMVSSRICKYTYGIEVTRPFMYSDPKELRIFESGQQYCGKAFLKLVEKGQEIKLDEAISTDDIEALYSDATFMSFNIYRSTKKEPAYVTEESCTYLGKLRVEFGPQKLKVKVWMRFGTSEIMVEGRDAKTEEPIPGSVTLDLLDNLQSE